ncbi:hypothetical protein CC2G_009085 [Coprinopsis cinerea AmutBmut pab1-1]|nr:hypothetical protein CC2G_009085 [Coprinopsis cinerea AmutBmut pab1-1]
MAIDHSALFILVFGFISLLVKLLLHPPVMVVLHPGFLDKYIFRNIKERLLFPFKALLLAGAVLSENMPLEVFLGIPLFNLSKELRSGDEVSGHAPHLPQVTWNA